MIRVFPFATALAAVLAVSYVLCALLALLAPGAFLTLFQTWIHGLDLARLAPGGQLVTLDRFVFGLVTVTLAGGLFGWAWATLHNALAAAQEARA